MSSSSNSHKAILYAFLANLGIALAKTWAAFFTGSGSMTAEAIHSFADCGNQMLLYLGIHQSQRPADAEHPMAYGKLSYFWSFIVAILLFSVGGLFSIYEGWHKLSSSEPLHQPSVGLVVLAVSVILEALSLRGCIAQITPLRGDRSLWDWLKTTRNAELVVVLGEDIAALVGLTFALIGLGFATTTGDTVYDALGSIAIGAVLVAVSVFVASHIKTLLVGRSAEPELEMVIKKVINEDPNVTKLWNLITLQFGPDIMVAAKIGMSEELRVGEVIPDINSLEERIKRTVPEVRWCFMELDNKD